MTSSKTVCENTSTNTVLHEVVEDRITDNNSVSENENDNQNKGEKNEKNKNCIENENPNDSIVTNGDGASGSPSVSSIEIEVTLPASGGHTIRGIRYEKIYPNEQGSSASKGEKNKSSDEVLSCNQWIFLHGWLDNAASFDRIIPFLLDSNSTTSPPKTNKTNGRSGNGTNKRTQDVIIALDLSGHGKSDHRKSAYYMLDYAAEVIQCADILFGPNSSFNILGHSLGASVALLVAGTIPAGRISRLVMLDSLGPFTMQHANEAPRNFSRSCQKMPSGSYSTFENVQEAAVRRAEKNVISDQQFTAEHAAVLCSRGLRTVEMEGEEKSGEKMLTWSSDPWLLTPTRLYLSESVVRAFVLSCSAQQTLVLMTENGALNRFYSTLKRLHITNSNIIFSYVFVLLLNAVTWLVSLIMNLMVLLGQGLTQSSKKLTTFLRGLEYLANGVQRVRSIQNCKTITLRSGGHHPHLTEPDYVAAELKKWIEETTVC